MHMSRSERRSKKTPNTKFKRALRREAEAYKQEVNATPSLDKSSLRDAATLAYAQWKNKNSVTPPSTLDDYLRKKY
jgi:hypothetical protein